MGLEFRATSATSKALQNQSTIKKQSQLKEQKNEELNGGQIREQIKGSRVLNLMAMQSAGVVNFVSVNNAKEPTVEEKFAEAKEKLAVAQEALKTNTDETKREELQKAVDKAMEEYSQLIDDMADAGYLTKVVNSGVQRALTKGYNSKTSNIKKTTEYYNNEGKLLKSITDEFDANENIVKSTKTLYDEKSGDIARRDIVEYTENGERKTWITEEFYSRSERTIREYNEGILTKATRTCYNYDGNMDLKQVCYYYEDGNYKTVISERYDWDTYGIYASEDDTYTENIHIGSGELLYTTIEEFGEEYKLKKYDAYGRLIATGEYKNGVYVEYDEHGYDKDGYDRNGYDKNGFNAEGYNADGYNADGYNALGYDKNGYDKDGFNAQGVNCENKTREQVKNEKMAKDFVNDFSAGKYSANEAITFLQSNGVKDAKYNKSSSFLGIKVKHSVTFTIDGKLYSASWTENKIQSLFNKLLSWFK